MTQPREMIGATIKGGPMNPELKGHVIFHEVPNGTKVEVSFKGLPEFKSATKQESQVGPFGLHIHEKGVCDSANAEQPFSSAGPHYNPTNQPHGNHIGDFPVIFSNHGYAWMSFFTDKFKPRDVVGRSIILHGSPDDYTSQPAGNSGRRIACGVIKRFHVNDK